MSLFRTPHRIERSSNVMVPGVKRDPALIFRSDKYKIVHRDPDPGASVARIKKYLNH